MHRPHTAGLVCKGGALILSCLLSQHSPPEVRAEHIVCVAEELMRFLKCMKEKEKPGDIIV
jgi:hypothetical protein